MEGENNNIVKKESKFSKLTLTQKIISIVAALLVYTLIVCSITVAIDRAVLKHELKKAFSESFSDIESDDKDSADSAEDIEEQTEKIEEKRKQFKLNDKVTIKDGYEIVLNKAGWSEKIEPKNKGDFYTYYKNEEGSKYFVLKGSFKNLSGETLDVSNLNHGELIVNGKYKSHFSFKIEETDGGGFDNYIKPLQTLDFIIFSSVSDEVYNECKSVELNLDLVTQQEDMNSMFIDSDTPTEKYVIKFDNAK